MRALALVAVIGLTILAITASSDRRSLIAPASGRSLHLGHELRVSTFDPRVDRIYGVDQSDRLVCINLREGSTTRWGRMPRALALALCPQGTELAAGDAEGRIVVLDAETGEARFRVEPPDVSAGRGSAAVSALVYHPSGRVLVGGFTDGTIRFHDASDGSPVGLQSAEPRTITQMAFEPSGAVLVSASAGGTLHIRDGSTGQSLKKIEPGRGTARFLAFAPDGRTLAASVGPDIGHFRSQVLLFKLADPTSPPRDLSQSDHHFDLSFTPDGRGLVACAGDGTIRLWDTRAGGPVSSWAVQEGVVHRIFLTSDGRRIVTIGVGDSIGVSHLPDGGGSS